MIDPVLAAVGVVCDYAGRVAVRGVDLAVHAGEVVAILGPNGAGKTTLLRALARLHRPTAGVVTLAGRDVWRSPASTIAREIAYAPQTSADVWPLTVAEFAALGRAPHRGWWRPLTPEDRHAVDRVLDRLALTALRDRPLPELSGGEAQRARLARALAQEPRVLLLDEPTAHLDPRFQFELLSSVRELARESGLAVGLTVHDLNLVGPWADRAVLLADGQVAATGTPGEVLTAATLERVYGVALAVGPHPVTGTPAVVVGPAGPRAANPER